MPSGANSDPQLYITYVHCTYVHNNTIHDAILVHEYGIIIPSPYIHTSAAIAHTHTKVYTENVIECALTLSVN